MLPIKHIKVDYFFNHVFFYIKNNRKKSLFLEVLQAMQLFGANHFTNLYVRKQFDGHKTSPELLLMATKVIGSEAAIQEKEAQLQLY